jgi:hypothetical protein
VHIVDPVSVAYEDLTGEIVLSDSQVRTHDAAVKTDQVYSIDDKMAILWEDKALPVFKKHMDRLLAMLQHENNTLFKNVRQQSWEGIEAILAKVYLLAIF